MGHTKRHDAEHFFHVHARNGSSCDDTDGCVTANRKIIGTYIHGLFENSAVTRHWLNGIELPNIKTAELDGLQAKDKEYDLLAEYFETYIDTNSIMDLTAGNIDLSEKS
jgi:adenosylcobyric acid synthase